MKNVVRCFKEYFDLVRDNSINNHAAACAFYMFLSMVPFVGIVTSVIPYTGLTQDTLLDALSTYIPAPLQSIIYGTVGDIFSASGYILPVAVVLTIYLASRAFSALIRGLEVISESRKFASFFRRTLLACLYTVALIAAMLLVLALLVSGKYLVHLISSELPIVTPFVRLLIRGRFVIAFVILTVSFMLIYRGVPGMKLGFMRLLPGAAAAAGSWLLFTWLFSLFIAFADSFTIYGNLAAIVISLLWMYWCMYIILLGAQLNIYIRFKKTALE